MKTKEIVTLLYGDQAIAYATKHDLLVSKFADATESARVDLTIGEAQAICFVDPSLVYIKVKS